MLNDNNTTIQDLRSRFAKFVADRQWETFHSPKNLVMGLAVETAELMEHFLWMENDESRKYVHDQSQLSEVADEIADVAGYVLCLCNAINLDLSSAIETKLEKNAQKYPADKYTGRYRL